MNEVYIALIIIAIGIILYGCFTPRERVLLEEKKERKKEEYNREEEITIIEGIRAEFGNSEEWQKIYDEARRAGAIFPQLKNCNGCKDEIECFGNRIADMKK